MSTRAELLIVEAKANTHLTHLEELVLTQGNEGYLLARAFLMELLETLKGNSTSKVQTSVKWDGAPAIFAGTNPENGKFFVGTKSIFNKEPKINYTPQDIIDNHGHAPGLVDKLTKALKYLPSLGIKNILQGDFMFDDEMLEVTEIDGEPHYRFKPNTIVYAVPVDSDIGREVGQSKFGIVFHTTYDSLDSGASYGADVSNLNRPPGIWFDDAFFTDDTGTVTLTDDEESTVRTLIKQADAVNSKIDYDGLPSDFLNIYINNEIRQGQFLENPKESYEGFIGWYQSRIEKKIDSLKTEKGKMRALNQGEEKIKQFESKKGDILNLFKVSRLLFEAKNVFINKYNNAVYNTKHFIDDGSGDLVVTNPEGYVAVDHIGNGVKFVDRLEFSRANFMMDKGFKKDVNESQILEVFWGGSGYSVRMSLKEWYQKLPKTTKTNETLFKKLASGVPITSLILDGSKVKESISEAVNWGMGVLTEESGKNIALYPGKFKPPHGGHFNVAKQIIDNPEVDKLIIWVSPKTHEGITADQAATIWEYYSKQLPEGVEIRIADITPVRSVYEYIEDEAQAGDDLHLVLGEKDISGGRFKTAASRRADVEVTEVPIPPQMGGISATQMRKALMNNDIQGFKEGLPLGLSSADINDIISILGGSLDEISSGAGGSVSGFAGRYPDVAGSEKEKARHPKDFIGEVSSMSGGDVQGGMIGTGSKKGPWHGFNAAAFNKRQKKDSTLQGTEELLGQEDEIVNEVVDYLIGITVG
jgi:hypothetical protein